MGKEGLNFKIFGIVCVVCLQCCSLHYFRSWLLFYSLQRWLIFRPPKVIAKKKEPSFIRSARPNLHLFGRFLLSIANEFLAHYSLFKCVHYSSVFTIYVRVLLKCVYYFCTSSIHVRSLFICVYYSSACTIQDVHCSYLNNMALSR